jgi:hypothetical protein
MKKNSSSKAAEVIAFLKANSVEISVKGQSNGKDSNSRRRQKISKVKSQKAS